jgi:hypothetical protein
MTNHADAERNRSFSSQTRPEFLMTEPTDHPVDETAVTDEKASAGDPDEVAVVSDDEIYPGDHGDWRAILCSVGVFLALFVGFGILNIPGTFVTYWETNQLVGYTQSQISWIAAVQFSLTLLGSVLTGRWFDMHGGRVTLPSQKGLSSMWMLIVDAFADWIDIVSLGIFHVESVHRVLSILPRIWDCPRNDGQHDVPRPSWKNLTFPDLFQPSASPPSGITTTAASHQE